MDRRRFLKIAGIGSAVVAVPAVAKPIGPVNPIAKPLIQANFASVLHDDMKSMYADYPVSIQTLELCPDCAKNICKVWEQ